MSVPDVIQPLLHFFITSSLSINNYNKALVTLAYVNTGYNRAWVQVCGVYTVKYKKHLPVTLDIKFIFTDKTPNTMYPGDPQCIPCEKVSSPCCLWFFSSINTEPLHYQSLSPQTNTHSPYSEAESETKPAVRTFCDCDITTKQSLLSAMPTTQHLRIWSMSYICFVARHIIFTVLLNFVWVR